MAENKDIDRIIEMHIVYARDFNRLRESLTIDGEDGVLLFMLQEEDNLLSGDLVTKTGLTSGRIANILKKLEQKKLIIRINDTEDKRKVHVHLTEAGKLRALQLNDTIRQTYESFLGYLGDENTLAVKNIMERMVEYVREPSGGKY